MPVDSLTAALQSYPAQDSGKADLLNHLSRACINKDAAMASRYANAALTLSDSIGYRKGKIYAIRNIALVENTRGNLERQMQLTLSALSLAEQDGDKQLLGILNNDVGNIFTEQQSARDALPYLMKALHIKEQLKETAAVGRTLNSIGAAYKQLERPDSALLFLRRAETIKLAENDRRGLAITYEHMGAIYFGQHRFPLAQQYLEQSADFYKESDNIKRLARVYLLLAETHTMRANFTTAKKYLQYASSLNEQLSVAQNEMLYFRIRAALDSAQKDYPAALASYKQFASRSLDFFKVEKSRQIASTQEKYETEKRQRENALLKREQQVHLATIQQQRVLVITATLLFIVLLIITVIIYRLYKRQRELSRELNSKNEEVSLQNRIILDQNTALANMNQVKDKIFSVISHDLRSPLAILEGLLFLLRDNKMNAGQFRLYTDELWRDVKNTAYMMDNMLQWASNQMKGTRVKADDFDICQLLTQEFDLLQTLALQKQIRLENQLYNSMHVYADPDMIRLVLRNLVSNAIKFTPTGGMIRVSAHMENDFATISVQDNGIGILASDQMRIFTSGCFSTRGTQNEKGCGLGLTLSKDFVERNQGRIWFTSAPEGGSCFSFTVPLSEDQETNIRGYTVIVQDKPVNGVHLLH